MQVHRKRRTDPTVPLSEIWVFEDHISDYNTHSHIRLCAMGKSSVACSFSRWIEPFCVASLRAGCLHINTTIKIHQISGKITAWSDKSYPAWLGWLHQ